MTSRRDALQKLQVGESFHPGLWLNAFPRSLDREDPDRIREHVDELISRGRVSAGYAAASQRREAGLRRLAQEGVAVRLYRATTLGRVAAGLGIASVVENGLRLDRTWGLPYLPGSSLKGVTRAYATLQGGDDWGPDAPAHCELFGTTAMSGLVAFHDAWWIPDGKGTLPFSRDVLTPHHQAWNSRLGKRGGGGGPQDTDAPVPVTFLTATGSFLVALSGPAAWVDAAGELLTRALQEEGIGAKTSAGYGRFSLERQLSDAERQEVARRKALEAVRGKVRDRLEPPGGIHPGNLAQDVIRPWMRDFEDEALQPLVREAAAALWRDKKDLVKKWARGPKRTEEERRFVDDVIRQDVAPPPSPAVSKQATESSWHQGLARIHKRGRRHRLEARVEGLTLRDIAVSNAGFEPPGLRDRMQQQVGREFDVDVEVKGGKVQGVRER